MSYSWNFLEAYLGKNSNSDSIEHQSNIEFKQLNSNINLNSINNFNGTYTGYQINSYDDIAYVDLSALHNPDASFTLEFKVVELDTVDTTKAVNYATLGYHIRGRSGVTLTIGRPENSANVVLGTITETSTMKATALEPSLVTEPNTEYTYTLMYNNYATNEEKLKLFRGPHLISSSSNLDIQNFSIIDRKLFLGSSAWMNEPSWSNMFDVARNIVITDPLSFQTDIAIDKSFLPGTPFYPIHHSFENTTDPLRNTNQIAVDGDVVSVQFHSTKDVPQSSVFMSIDGQSNNISQVNVENTYLLPNSSNTILYTYQFQVTNTWPIDGIISYGLDFDGSVTASNIFPLKEDNIYIDNTVPTLAFDFNSPSASNISFAITSITDAYYDVMTHQPKFGSFIVDFYASNNDHIKTTQITNPIVNQSYFVEDLSHETIYNLYATLTDRAGNTTDRILPNNGTTLVETNDITSPIIANLLATSTKDVGNSNLPGISVSVDTYDTASALTINTHNYTLRITILDYELVDEEVALTLMTTHNYVEVLKTNAIAETTTADIYNYFDNTGTQHPIRTEKLFFVHCLVVDNAGNKLLSKTSRIIDNTITFDSMVTDFTDNKIATTNNNIILNFSSEYKLFDKSQFVVTMMDDVIENSVTVDGLNWVASNQVNDTTHSSGPVTFSVSQTNDIGDTISSFTNPKSNVFIQNVQPNIRDGVTFGTDITTITVNNIANFIDDYTINSNNNLVKITLETDSQVIENTYNNITEIPEVFTFVGLAESTTFEILASISNVFSESNNIVLGSQSTLSDIPSITVNAQNDITAEKEPFIRLLSTATVSEQTTPFDLYLEVTDFVLNDLTEASNFFTNTVGISKRGTSVPPGGNIPIGNIMGYSNINTFWTQSNTTFSNTTIAPSTNSTYYVYGLIDDKTNLAMDSTTINFSYTYTNATLSNTSYPYFVRNNDTIVMSWDTTFQSKVGDFANLKIYDIDITPTTVDNLAWTAEVTIPSTGPVVNNHSLSYLGNTLTVDDTNIFFDNVPPSFTMTLESKTRNTFEMSLSNVVDTLYSNAPVPVGIDNTFTAEFNVSNLTLDQTYTTSNLSFANISINTYLLDNLEEAAAYTISCKLIDPANNSTTIQFNEGNLVKTTDSTIPVVTNSSNQYIGLDTVSTHLIETNYVTLSNIQAHDVHGVFDVYAGLFDTSNLILDLQMLKDNSNTTAVIYSHSNPPSPHFMSFDGIFENVLTASNDSYSNIPLEYERNYYIYIAVEDDSGNFTLNDGLIYNTVTMLEGPPTAYEFPAVIDPDDTLAPTTTNSVVFQPVLDDDAFTEGDYVGYDVTGNNNHVFISTEENINPLSTDSVVNEYSLDLGLTTGVALSTSLPESFTYSTWVKNTNDEYTDTVLLANGTNDFITVSETGVTINSGVSIFFPVDMNIDSWDNVMVSVEGSEVTVHVNGVQILPSGSIEGFVTPVTGPLSIPSQENILVDGITLFDIPVNELIIETIVNTGEFVIHLNFEEGAITDYEVSFSNNLLLLNGEIKPELSLKNNTQYTFHNYNTDVPFIISQAGTFPVSETDLVNVDYFINNVNIGNDPFRYSLEFRNNTNNKVVLLTDVATTPVVYHSTSSNIVPVAITVEDNGLTLIQNRANDSESAQPTYSMVPSFSTNTTVGDYAMVFDGSQQTAFNFNNFQIDANHMAMSAWVNTDFALQTENPVITQAGIFEFGINSNGNTYLKLLNNDTPASYINTIDLVSMDDIQVSFSNIQLTSPVTNPTYLYAIATTNRRDKATVMDLMDTHRDSANMHFQTITTETSIPSIDVSKVMDITDTFYGMNAVNQAYVYLSARAGSNAYAIGDANEYYEYKVSIAGNINNPHSTITTVTQPTSTTSGLIVNSGTLFSNKAAIAGYYVFAFVTGVPGAEPVVDLDDLTEANVVAFFNTYISPLFLSTGYTVETASKKYIYYSTSGLPAQYEVGSLTADLTIHQAFNTLSGTSKVDITNVANWFFVPVLVVVDNSMRYGFSFAKTRFIEIPTFNDMYKIPITTSISDWSIVFEVYVEEYDSVSQPPSTMDILALGTVQDNSSASSSRLYTKGGAGGAHWYSGFQFVLGPPTTSIVTNPELNTWTKYGLTKSQTVMLNNEISSISRRIAADGGNPGAMSQLLTIGYGYGGGTKWRGQIRNIAIFNTSIDLNTLPSNLSTLNTTAFPSLQTYFQNGSQSCTIGSGLVGSITTTY
uniref:Uncharacterized protein n=1 Tax=Pyramimonas orientalis virus TaxID=455367 RepID=A0A7M3UNT8_POV01|nr:hypothetical protein HWQ62_00236 [Pyramimonas orientalis virus]